MYTFGILALFFLLLSGAIFGKNIKKNQHLVAMIVVAGTLVGSIIVNGVLGLSIPYTQVEIKKKALILQDTDIMMPTDTLEFDSYVEFNYQLKPGKDETNLNHLDVNLWDDVYHSERDMITVEFLPEGDSIPYIQVFREKRIVDNKWITPFGLPNGKKQYVAYIPNDSIHNVLMDQLNEKFFTDEKEKIAQSN